ncbi:phage tail protein [Burkholderia cenocepacia]|uniref:phage tail protein n=1 Tax=Burkholderia cenocepacia TaxID=95486 RepID=UPI001AA1C88B|nr:phage tail protein [Burkholderia cenocepacia]MBO1856853.1 phage tail protein [Burkholderia cenocepacia]
MAFNLGSIALDAVEGGFGIGNVSAVADQLANDLLQTQIDTAPYMLLGDVSFLVFPFKGSETRKSADFVEHKLIEGKPRLQWVGDALDEITWHLVFHVSFCSPEAEVQKLEQLLASHAAAPLFSANGESLGVFVVTSITKTTRWTLDDGTLLCLEASVDLKEFVVPPAPVVQSVTQAPVAAQQRTASGTLNPPGTVNTAPTSRPADAPVTRN